MSTTVDSRVLEMRFDNKHFESNVSTTMSTLDKLKQKLNLTGAARGLEDLNTAAKNVNMTGLGTAVDTVRTKFSALEVMGVTALANIANSAVNAGKRMVSALTVEPIMDGFREYEMTLNAVQTTMAATGMTAKEVEEELKKLDEYADKTVYSTADMLNNLPKFTNAGVELSKATTAMIGIANATALAGGDAQKASIAFYNLGQAIGTGYLTRMDYNSINNAGIATMKWKEQMVEAAIAAGTLTDAGNGLYKAGKKTFTLQQLFIDGLQEQWATTDVMMTVFGKYGNALDEDVGKQAYAAAQDIKTFTQMMESLKATAGTGWKETWELMFGGLEDAKTLWTGVSEFLSGIINKMTKFRNGIINSALGRGFTRLAEKINDVAKPINKTVDSVTEAVKTLKSYSEIVDEIISGKWGNGKNRWDKLTEAGYDWAHAQNLVNEKLGVSLRRTTSYTEEQKETEKATAKLTETEAKRIAQLAKLSDAQLKNAGYSDKQIESIRELTAAADKLGLPLEEFLTKIDEINGRWLFINSFKNIGDAISQFATVIGQAWGKIFPNTSDSIANGIFNAISAFHKLTSALGGFIDESGKLTDKGDKLRRTFEGIFAALDILATVASGPIGIAFRVLKSILEAFDLDVLSVTAAIGDVIVKFRDWLDSVLDFSKVFEKIVPYIERAIDAVKRWIDMIKNSSVVTAGKNFIVDFYNKIVESVKGLGGKLFSAGGDIIQGLINGIRSKFGSVWDTITNFVSSFIEKFCNLLGIESPSTVFFAIGGFIIAGLIAGLQNSGVDVVEFFKNLFSGVINTVKGFDWSQITALVRAIGSFLPNLPIFGQLGNIFYLIQVAGKDLAASFRSIGGDTMQGLADGITGGFSGVWAAVTTLAKSIIEKVCDIFDIRSPSRVMFAIGGFLILGLIMGLKDGAPSLWGVLKNGGNECVSMIQTFGNKVMEMVKALDLGTVISVGLATGFLFVINRVAKAIESVGSLGGVFTTIKSTIKGVGDAIKKHIQAKSVQVVANAVLQLAVAIAILAAALFVVSKIDADRLWPAFGAISALFGLVVVLTGAMAALMFLASKIEGFDGFAKAALTIAAVAGSLVLLTLTIKILSGIEAADLSRSLDALLKMVAGMAAILIAMAIFGKTQNNGAIARVGGMMLGISAALLLMIGVVKLASKLDAREATKGLICIAAISILFGALIKVSQYAGDNALKAAGMIMLMTMAFGAMIAVIKMASKMNAGEVFKGIAVVTAVGLLFAVLTAVSNVAGDNALKAGGMMLGMAVALLAAAVAIKMIAGMDEADVKKGLKVVAALEALFMVVIAVSYLAGEHAAEAGKLLLSMSAALLVMTGVLALIALMVKTDADSVYKALGIVAALELLLTGLVAVSHLAKDVKVGPLLMILLAITVLSGVLIALAVIDPEGLGRATASMSAIILSLTALVASLKLISGAGGVSKSAIGAMAGLVIVIAALTYLMHQLSDMPSPLSVIPIAIGIGILLNTMASSLLILDYVTSISSSAMSAMAGLVIIIGALALLLNDFSTMPSPWNTIPIALGIGVLLNTMASSLFILDYVTGISASAMTAMFELTAIVLALAAILRYMGEMPSPESAIPAAIALGTILTALSVAVAILSMVGVKATAASAAIVPMMKLVAAIAAIVVALGALYQLPFMDTLLRGGGEALALIGTAIGNFIGGIGKGIATTFVEGLPEIGANLSAFMLNVTPFVAGIKMVDESTLNGATNLAKAVAALAVADFISSCGNFLKIGSSLPGLGNDLSKFIMNALPGLAMAKTIDPSIVENVKALAETMLILTAADWLDRVTGWIGGGNSMVDFGEQLAAFGPCLVAFAQSVSGIDEKSLNAMKISAEAGKLLAEMAAAFPNSGGWLDKILGGNDADTFGKQLEAFGASLMAYGKSVSGIDAYIDSIKASVSAGKSLTELAESIPDSGGFIADFFGDNTADMFGKQLEAFGASLMAYGKSVSGIDAYVDAIKQSVEAGAALSELAASIPESGGFIADFFGDNAIDDFGKQLEAFGSGLKAYGISVSDIGDYKTGIENSSGIIDTVITIFNKVKDELDFDWGESEIDKLGNGLSALATGISQFTTAMTAAGDLSNAQTLVENAVGIANYVNDELDWDAGAAEIVKLGQDLASFGQSIVSYYTSVGSISTISDASVKSAVEMANYVKNNLTKDYGEAEITKLGKDIEIFGRCIANYGQNLAAMGDISSSETTVNTLVAIANKIKTGIVDNDVDITIFGTHLSTLASKMAAFSKSISEIGDITTATATIDGIISIYNKLTAAFPNNSTSSTGVSTGFSNLGSAIESVSKALGAIDPTKAACFSAAVDSLVDASGKLANVNIDSINALGTSLKTVGADSIQKFVSGITTASKKVPDTINGIVTKMTTTMSTGVAKFKKIGSDTLKSYLEGMRSYCSTHAKTAVDAIVKTMCLAAGSPTNYNNMYNAGVYLGKGLVLGIESKETAAYNAGYALGQAAVQGELDGQASESPSKLTIQAGKWLGEGLIIGMDRMSNSVYKAGSNLGSTATDTISNTISRIADAIDSDMDTQPTIRPVLDLSDVSSGANAIGDMLGLQPSLGLLTNVGSINTMMNRRNQNGANSEVISAIKDLKKSMENMPGDTYTFGDVTYGDDSVVSTAVHDLVRAIRVERRA